MNAHDKTTTLRGPGAPAEPPPSNPDRTRTLRGLGFKSNTLRGLGEPAPSGPVPAHVCPGCRVKADAVSGDLAAMLGIAIVFVKGAESARAGLCTMHARLLRLLVDEIKTGPKRVGEGDSWDD